MTELYMLQDKSPDFKDTWDFLEERIADGAVLHSVFSNSDKVGQNMQRAFGTTFETVCTFETCLK